MKINSPQNEEEIFPDSIRDFFSFHGQIGPVYLFSDAISSEQVQGIYSLGPSYMYSFLDNEATPFYDSSLPSGILDAKDGLSSKIIFGLNAQVCCLIMKLLVLKACFGYLGKFKAVSFFFRQVMARSCLMFHW